MYMWYITLPGIFYEASKEQKPPRYTVKTPSIYEVDKVYFFSGMDKVSD